MSLKEGLENSFKRHRVASEALTTGSQAMGLRLFGDQEHKMPNATGVIIPAGIDGEAVRHHLLENFRIEIDTSFGPLRGKVWRMGTMGYNCRKQNVLMCLAALESALLNQKFDLLAGRSVQTALSVYDSLDRSGDGI